MDLIHTWRTLMSNQILRLASIKNLTGLSRSTIYQRIAEKRFPKPISLGGRAVGWVHAEIDEWIEQQIETSRKKQLDK